MAMVVISAFFEVCCLLADLYTERYPNENKGILYAWRNAMVSFELSFVYCVVIGLVLAVMADSHIFDNYHG